VHDIGKIVMAATFPEHFAEIQRRTTSDHAPLLPLESEVLGMHHAELGARCFRNHNLPEVMIESAGWHDEPERASHPVHI